MSACVIYVYVCCAVNYPLFDNKVFSNGILLLLAKQIRLMDGPNLVNEGRVEVYDDDQWYGLCAYNWDTNGADVVCRHLGYHYAIIANRNHYGSSGRTSNFSFSCTGNENSIDECSTISLNLCQSTAGVVCSSCKSCNIKVHRIVKNAEGENVYNH